MVVDADALTSAKVTDFGGELCESVCYLPVGLLISDLERIQLR